MKTKRFLHLFFALLVVLATVSFMSAEALADPPYEDGEFSWAKRMGGTGYDGGSSIVADSSGNVYITGTFQDTVDFDPGDGVMNLTSSGAAIYVSKLDGSGNLSWAKSVDVMGGIYPTRIALDSSGNVYITGTFSGTINFDPSTGISNLTAGDDDGDIFVFKLDGNGDIIWAKSMVSKGGGWYEDTGNGIAVDSSGNVYTTGCFSGTVDFDPGPEEYNVYSGDGIGDAIFISKLDNNGNFVWVKSMGSAGEDFGVGIAVDSAGNVYTAGGFSYTVDFDPGTGTFNLTSAGKLDIFVSKLDSDGNFVWAKNMGGANHDGGSSGLKLDSAGNIYTTGVFPGTADFDPGADVFNLTSAGGLDIFISKLDSDGNFVWAKSMGGPEFDCGNSAVDLYGNVYTSCGFRGTSDFDPGIGTYNLTSAGELDIFISKLDSNGNFVWAKRIGGAYDELGSVGVDPIGNVYITAGFSGTLDFDPGPGIFELTSAGATDIFVLKLWRNPSNLPPVADAGGPYTAFPGDNITLDASNSYDPEGGILTYEWDLDNDGEYDDGTDVIIDYSFPEDGNYQVGLKVKDVYGEEDTDIAKITVTNVSPIVNLAQGASIYEGATFAENGSFSDPGFDSWTATVDYDDGAGVKTLALNPDKSFSLVHTYLDNGNYTVQVCVTDDNGGVGCAVEIIIVTNVSPIVNLAQGASIHEGATFTENGSFSDPGFDSWTATVDYGDGAGVKTLELNPDKTFSLGHTYLDNGIYTVRVCVTDDDDGVGCAVEKITVTNVSPIVSITQGTSIREGGKFIRRGSFSDPGFDSWTATVDYGDGTGVNKQNLNFNKTFTLTHTYSDNGNYPAQVCVTDDDGGVGCYTVTVEVDNVAPSIRSINAPIDPVQVDMAIETNATFTDPGTGDTHTATWDWGDGMTSEGSVDGRDVGGSHVYDAAGIYTLTLTVEDDDGGMGSASFEYIIVYNPDGGFVTGSGWITSPEGAYTPDPSLTGKATFGIVSKYQNGANVPTGDTEFQFNMANLHFESISYDWLVIAGTKAQYKGTGTINGAGAYKFILTAIDGSPDMFRIKIWDKETGETIYDNQLSAGDNSSEATELGGGSIVVHK